MEIRESSSPFISPAVGRDEEDIRASIATLHQEIRDIEERLSRDPLPNRPRGICRLSILSLRQEIQEAEDQLAHLSDSQGSSSVEGEMLQGRIADRRSRIGDLCNVGKFLPEVGLPYLMRQSRT